MNKFTAILALASILVGGAFANQKAKPKPTQTPTTIACPVEGGKVNIADATKHHMYTDYKGNRYFFCCGGCPETFKADPKKYASKPHIKTPVAKTKAKTKGH